MAAIPLNKFRTITHTLTTSSVGIYTCPPGVASLIVFANVANVGSGTSTVSFSAFHSRGNVDTPIIEKGQIPNQDSMSFIEGRLVLETADILKVKSEDEDGTQKIIISILENAK